MTAFDTIDITGFTPATLADQPQPMLIWADLADLVIDRRYQRDITRNGRMAIQRIANAFDWRKYQPILVAPTEGGKLAVVDGQHRAHAAMLCGIEKLPAMTVPMTPQEQAAGFAAINRDRITMNASTIYRAELAAGTEWAVESKAAVEAAGCTLATSNRSHRDKRPGQVYATNLIRKMIQNGEAAAVTAGLRAIRESESGDEIESYGGPVLGVWLPAIAINQRFMTLDLPAIFDSLDILTMIDEARAQARRTGEATKSIVLRQVVARLTEYKDEAA